MMSACPLSDSPTKATVSSHLMRTFTRPLSLRQQAQMIPADADHLVKVVPALAQGVCAGQEVEQRGAPAGAVRGGRGDDLESRAPESEPGARHVPGIGDEIDAGEARGLQQ